MTESLDQYIMELKVAPSQQSLRPKIELTAMMQHPRLGKMILLIWDNQEDIIGTDKGQLVFDWAGGNTEAKLSKRLDCQNSK